MKKSKEEQRESEREDLMEKELRIMKEFVENLTLQNRKLQQNMKKMSAEASKVTLLNLKYEQVSLEAQRLTLDVEKL